MVSKQLKKIIDKQEEVRKDREVETFNRFVPSWIQWLLTRSIRFRRFMRYEIGTVDGDTTKMIITRRGKVIGKTF